MGRRRGARAAWRRASAGAMATAAFARAWTRAMADAGSMTSGFQRPEASPAVPLRATRGRATANADAVTQVHLAPTGAGEMSVVWATREALDEDAAVEYYASASDGRQRRRAEAMSASYTTQLCVGSPTAFVPRMGTTPAVDPGVLMTLANTSAWADADASNYRSVRTFEDVIPSAFWTDAPMSKGVCLDYANPDAVYHSPIVHTAKMTGLMAGERYSYALPGSETTRSFRAPKTPKKHGKETTKIAVVGDTGQTDVTREVLTHVRDALGDSELLIHTGDVSYADGFAPRWDSFGTLSEFLLDGMPMLTVPGNHDVAQNGMDLVSYMARYPSPYTASKSPSQLFWSHEVGQAHIIGLNSYANSQIGVYDGADTPQMAWLRKDLATINRQYTPWVVVVFHAPWYNSNRGHFKEAERMRKALEQILFDAGVDLVFNGHVHAYERSHPVHDFHVHECGPVHVVVGDGGNYEGPYGNSWMEPQPSYSAFREGSFGAGSLTIHNDTHATWEWRRTTCVANTTSAQTYFERTGEASTCRTIPDISAQAMEPVDVAIFRRDVDVCPNKLAGTAARTGASQTPYIPESSTTALSIALVAILLLWLATSVALIRALKTTRDLRMRIYRSPRLLSTDEDEFNDGEFSAVGLKDFNTL